MQNRRIITIIAAMARNRAIGLAGAMPWRLPGELRHFKETTMGKPIVMGRKTWESIGRALPGRQNIVVTRNRGYRAENCLVVQSLSLAIEGAEGDEILVIGGGQLYRQALPAVDRMVLTLVDCAPAADTWFPEWNESEWTEISRRSQVIDENNELAFEIIELIRVSEKVREPGTFAGPPA
jgi:dihydrofolate reductase